MGCASVVIPAYNEATVIGATLDALLAEAEPDEFDVVVVCNGCSDATAHVARQRTVRVLEIDEASKVAALNAGDRAARGYPLLYLDADVLVDTDSARRVVRALETGALAAAPLPVVDLKRCGAISRAYFAVWRRLGYTSVNALGSGFYGLSAAGRARFGTFPDLIADDGFVYSHFAAAERVNPEGATFTIRAPRDVGSLVRRRARIDAGNLELVRVTGRQVRPPRPAWFDIVKEQPRLLPAGLVYLMVNFFARLSARRDVRDGRGSARDQDRSSREEL